MAGDMGTTPVKKLLEEGKLVIGDGYRAKNEELSRTGLPFARAQNIDAGFKFDGADCFPEASLHKVGNKVSQPGDVVFTSKGTVGRFAFVREDTPRFVYSPQLCFWRSLDNDTIAPRWLYYWMHGREFGLQYKGVAGQTDMADYVSLRDQRRMSISLPEPAAQRAIAHILGTLEDKIEMNRRINKTLEAIARAIFKSWFIDFDPVRAKASGEPLDSIGRRLGLTPKLLGLFPDRLVDSECGKIPDGWNIWTVEELALRVGMGPFGSNIKVSTFVSQGVPVISGQHLNGTMLEENSFNFVTTEHADRLASANVHRGDLIFTHAGNIGQVAYVPDHSRYERYVLSQRQFYMRPDLSMVSPIFMTYYFRSPRGQHQLLANASQVGVPSIARPVSYLKSIRLVAPGKPLGDEFDELVRTFHHLISAHRSEIALITELLDTLLPKLLSGELRVLLEGTA